MIINLKLILFLFSKYSYYISCRINFNLGLPLGNFDQWSINIRKLPHGKFIKPLESEIQNSRQLINNLNTTSMIVGPISCSISSVERSIRLDSL